MQPVKKISAISPWHKYTWVMFLASAAIILVILPLFQKGTFIDGMLYKAVAYNYAENLSTFWRMKFTNTSMRFFCEQPPLYFYLLGSFYKLFGTGYLSDRFFTLLLFILLVLFLNLLSRQLFKTPGFYYLLILFFVFSIPVLCWGYVNQVIEPLVSLFTILGVYFFVRFLNSGKTLFACLFFINLYLLFLSKGFQSCFIVALPLIYFLISGLPKKYIWLFVAAVFTAVLCFTLKLIEPSANWFTCYYSSRLLLTMQNVGNTTDSHFEIITRFFTELIIPILILLMLAGFLAIKKQYPFKLILKNFAVNKMALALLLTSFIGSFPYAISLVQRGFYLIPSMICFIIAIVYGFKRYWLLLGAFTMKVSGYKIARIIVVLVFSASVFLFCFCFSGYKRDEKLLSDLELITPYLPQKDTVLIEGSMWNYFTLHASLYMSKQVNLSIDPRNRKFFIRSKSSPRDLSQLHYSKIELDTRELDLFMLQ